MRGISLPIEMIVIIAIAVLVLVVIVAFFVGGAGTQMSRISDQDALTRGCTELVLRGTDGCETPLDAIKITGYNATCNGLSGNTLKVACCRMGYKIYNYADPNSCQQLACRCPAPA